jgi:hypothetical protein
MNKYQDGKIYSLECNGLVYVGSTIRTLCARYKEHKWRFNNGITDCCSKQLFETGNEVSCKVLEHFPCNNKRELEQRESYWIDKLECINQKKSFVTKEEAKVNQREYGRTPKIKSYKHEWYIEHQDEKKEYDLTYRELNKDKHYKQNECECGGTYLTKHKSTHIKTKKHLEYYAKS